MTEHSSIDASRTADIDETWRSIAIPISSSSTNVSTIEYALSSISRSETSNTVIHLIYIDKFDKKKRGRIDDVRRLVNGSISQITDHESDVCVVPVQIGVKHVIFEPADHAAILIDYIISQNIDQVILDPGYTIDASDATLAPIRPELQEYPIPVDVAPIQKHWMPSWSELHRATLIGIVVFGFYLVLAGSVGAFDVITGAVTAGFSGYVFRNVMFERTPRPRYVLGVMVRGCIYIPYFLWKIASANIQISYLVLHPKLPIDPHLDRVETTLRDGLAITGFANSITLTPGTLTVDAIRNTLFIHSITEGSRHEILDGSRERYIQFVFYGRNGEPDNPSTGQRTIQTLEGPRDAETVAIRGESNE